MPDQARPLVQLRLHREYPCPGLDQAGPRSAGIHQRPPRRTSALQTHWTPLPCTRLSRARTTTGPPPHFASVDRRQVFPAMMAGTDEVVPTFTLEPFNRVRAQLCPCNLAMATPQSFTVASRPATSPAKEFSNRSCRSGARCYPAPICQVSSWWFRLRGFPMLVPRVHLSASLAGPAPSGSTGASRRCQGCFRLPRCPPAQVALSFNRPAATGRWRWPPTTARFKNASWRSISAHHT